MKVYNLTQYRKDIIERDKNSFERLFLHNDENFLFNVRFYKSYKSNEKLCKVFAELYLTNYDRAIDFLKKKGIPTLSLEFSIEKVYSISNFIWNKNWKVWNEVW